MYLFLNSEVIFSFIFMNLPFIYRIHEYPKEEKIRSFLGFVSSLGYTITGNVKDVKPTDFLTTVALMNGKRITDDFTDYDKRLLSIVEDKEIDS